MKTISIFVVALLLASCASDGPVAEGNTELVGERGPQGDTGPKGDEGPQGPEGPRGAVGSVGPQGTAGLQGPQGPQGDQGAAGLQGPMGLQGPQGSVGATGATGSAGSNGAQGPAGPQGQQGPIGPASMERMMYISSTDDVLGLMVMTSTPTHNEGMVMSPAFYSEGTTIEAGWVVPSVPTTIYWDGPSCGQGNPYLRVGVSRPMTENQLYWAPGSSLYALTSQTFAADNVLIKSVQTPTGTSSSTCSFMSLNTYIDDMMLLDITPVVASPAIMNFPWLVAPESSLP